MSKPLSRFFPVLGTSVANRDIGKIPPKDTTFLDPTNMPDSEDQLQDWFEEKGMVGFRTGDTGDGHNIVVLDFDLDRMDDTASRFMADMQRFQPAIVQTPGGYHFYFNAPTGMDFRNDNRGTLGKGVDVRGYHGYVCAPGSKFKPGEEYILEDGDPYDPNTLPELPRALQSQLYRKPRESRVDVNDYIDDTPDYIDEIKYRISQIEDQEKGSRGNQLYLLAQYVKDAGISEDVAVEIIKPLLPEGIKSLSDKKQDETIRNAYYYGTENIGSAHPNYQKWSTARLLGNVPEGPYITPMPGENLEEPKPKEQTKPEEKQRAPALKRAKFNFRTASTITLPVAMPWIVEDYVQEKSVVFLYGRSGLGKSFISLDMAHSVALGLPFAGKRTQKCKVMYMATEGGRGFDNRILALRQKPESQGIISNDLIFCTEGLQLNATSADMKLMVDTIRETGVGLVIIDTFGKAFQGSAMDDADVQPFLKILETLAVELNVSFLFVHHPGKDVERGMRGSGEFYNMVDTVLTTAVKPEDAKKEDPIFKNSYSNYYLAVEKQKEGTKPRPVPYILDGRIVGTDLEGMPITSCVVNWLTGADMMDETMRAASEAGISPEEMIGNAGDLDIAFDLIDDVSAPS